MKDTTKQFRIKVFLIFFITSIFILTLVIGIIFSFVKNKNIIGSLLIFFIIFFLLFIFIIPLPTFLLFKDYNEEIYKKYGIKPTIEGSWTNVYDLGNGKVLKQIASPGINHTDFSHVKLPTPFRQCTHKSCTIPCLIAHKTTTDQMWLSIERQLEMTKQERERFFPKIYFIDKKKKQYICEKIPFELEKNTCPKNFKKQLYELNELLKKYNIYIDDIHRRNIMVDKNGQIKIIDGEIYTQKEFEVKQKLLDNIDGSQKEIPKGYKYANRVMHWKDGRKSGEDVCLTEGFGTYKVERFTNFNFIDF